MDYHAYGNFIPYLALHWKRREDFDAPRYSIPSNYRNVLSTGRKELHTRDNRF